MQDHGLLYGFVCMVGQHNVRAITEPSFLCDLAAAGCVVGVYSRYFALAPAHADELRLSPSALAHHEQAVERARAQQILPLIDLDEVEAHTGCRSRSGTTVYVDGVDANVAPCVRAPYSPADCRLGGPEHRQLAEVLEHPFFVAYRQGSSPVRWCGEDLAAELGCVAAELRAFGVCPPGIEAYRHRSRMVCDDERTIESGGQSRLQDPPMTPAAEV
jgi:hypothetical protein